MVDGAGGFACFEAKSGENFAGLRAGVKQLQGLRGLQEDGALTSWFAKGERELNDLGKDG
jgi:hypothetical protein